MFNYFRNLPAEKFNKMFPPGFTFKFYPVRGIPDFVSVRTLSLAWELNNKAIVRVSGESAPVSIMQLEPEKQDEKNYRYHLESIMRAWPEHNTTHQLALRLLWHLDNSFPKQFFDTERQRLVTCQFHANKYHTIVDIIMPESPELNADSRWHTAPPVLYGADYKCHSCGMVYPVGIGHHCQPEKKNNDS